MARGSYRKTSSGKWEVRYYDTHGKQRSKGGFRTKGDAETWHDRIMREQASGVDHTSDLTFEQLVEDYLASHEASPARIEALTGRLKHATRDFGKVRVVDLSPRRIAMWRASGMSENTRHDAFAAVKQVLEAAVVWRIIPINPAKGIKNPAPKPQEMSVIPDWQTVLELEAAMPVHYHGMLVALVGTGLRPQEWTKLRWEHVDLDAKVLRLPIQVVKPKTPSRNVPLRDSVVDALASRERAAGLVFTTEQGHPIDIRNWRKREWARAQRTVNAKRRGQGRDELPALRPYDMRHTYATWALRAGMNTFALAKRMGTSVKMIDATYGHFAADSEDHERAMLNAFDQLSTENLVYPTVDLGAGNTGSSQELAALPVSNDLMLVEGLQSVANYRK